MVLVKKANPKNKDDISKKRIFLFSRKQKRNTNPIRPKKIKSGSDQNNVWILSISFEIIKIIAAKIAKKVDFRYFLIK
jgi:hypothetical protein